MLEMKNIHGYLYPNATIYCDITKCKNNDYLEVARVVKGYKPTIYYSIEKEKIPNELIGRLEKDKKEYQEELIKEFKYKAKNYHIFKDIIIDFENDIYKMVSDTKIVECDQFIDIARYFY